MIYLSVVYPRRKHFSSEPLSTASVPSLTDASLTVDYIYLNSAEQAKFAQASHEYLIEQTDLGPHTPPFAYPPMPVSTPIPAPLPANSFDSVYAPAFVYPPVSTHPAAPLPAAPLVSPPLTPLETWKKKMHEKVRKQIGIKRKLQKPLDYTIREEWETGDSVSRMRTTRLPSKTYTRLPRRRRRLDP